MNATTQWCFDCDGARPVEDLSIKQVTDTISRIAATLRSATPRRKILGTSWQFQSYSSLDQGLSIVRKFRSEDWQALGAMLAEESLRLDFLSRRTAPAKCLICFGHNVAELPGVDEGGVAYETHPGCGGKLEISIQGSLNISSTKRKRVFRPDGTFSHDEAYESSDVLFPRRFD